ncbi:hypothetical protein KPH14_009279 [Odynerus spinipes]|uniref:Reverse transcriptase domain-containing protein n=1 Tax=Odynerus spinipes TaxID=1348599 RepID=A0AAD9RP04_9HYME|nr:hypothetical protein KPH14_009279 [Odynerus spinipes]
MITHLRSKIGFQQKHATIEQVHRLTKKIRSDLNDRRYCSAAFLDISQAFDKVWHTDRFFQVKLQQTTYDLYPINSVVPQGSVLGPPLYTLYTSDFPKMNNTLIGTFADDTAILTSDQDSHEASNKLQQHLNDVESWLKTWRIKINTTKSTHVTFTTRKNTCPPVKINNEQLPQQESIKYLGVHLDRKLLWKTHIRKKVEQLNAKYKKLWWLIGAKSQLTTNNKLLIYKTILKPIWTYACQLWGAASDSNVKIIERWQNKKLRLILKAEWYTPNKQIYKETGIPTVKEEIAKQSKSYQLRLTKHPNNLATKLLDISDERERLKRHHPLQLPYRFSK